MVYVVAVSRHQLEVALVAGLVKKVPLSRPKIMFCRIVTCPIPFLFHRMVHGGTEPGRPSVAPQLHIAVLTQLTKQCNTRLDTNL